MPELPVPVDDAAHRELADIARVRALRSQDLPRDVPKRMTLQITNLCNSRCVMCSIWKIYPENKEKFQEELSGDEWLTVASKAIDQGVESIDITGGEPFLKEKLVELLTLLLKRLKFAGVTTNALQPARIAGDIQAVLQQAPADSLFVVSVSIDGFRDTYARVRGIEDGFDRAITLLRTLNAMKERYPQLATNVSFTILDSNWNEMLPLMDQLMAEKIITEADQFTFRPVSSGAYYARDNALDHRAQIIKVIEDLQKKYELKRTRGFVDGIPRSLREPKKMQLPCYAMFASCWVDPYGGVSPCVSMTEQIVGNLRDTDLDLLPVWRSERARRMRARIRKDQCPVCWTDCQAIENIHYSKPVPE